MRAHRAPSPAGGSLASRRTQPWPSSTGWPRVDSGLTESSCGWVFRYTFRQAPSSRMPGLANQAVTSSCTSTATTHSRWRSSPDSGRVPAGNQSGARPCQWPCRCSRKRNTTGVDTWGMARGVSATGTGCQAAEARAVSGGRAGASCCRISRAATRLRAAIVTNGLTPTADGNMPPSSTCRPWCTPPSRLNTVPCQSTTPPSASSAMGQPPSGCTVMPWGLSSPWATSLKSLGSGFHRGLGKASPPEKPPAFAASSSQVCTAL